MANNKKTREKYSELEMLKNRAKNIQEQIKNINSRVLELMESVSALEQLKNYGKGDEVLIPLGSNSFTKAKLLKTDKIMMNVGSGVMIEKKIEEGKETIEEQIKVLENVEENLKDRLGDLRVKMEKLQMELSELIS